MKHAIFFTLYGMAVGALYASILADTIKSPLLSSSVCIASLVALFGVVGWHFGRAKELTFAQRMVIVPGIPFLLTAALLGLTAILLMAAFFVPLGVHYRLQRERAMRRRLKAQGRFATLAELRPRLSAGEGTLIVETGHKGPYRTWWTQDDLSALGPDVATDEEFMGVLLGKVDHAFNARCLAEYLDEEKGQASLTSIRPRLVASGNIAAPFNRVPIVRVVQPYVTRAHPANSRGED